MTLLQRVKRLLGLLRDRHGRAGEGTGEISCEDALEKLFEYLDGELEAEDRVDVARHLAVCRRCYPRLQFERAFQEAVRRVSHGELPSPRLRERVLEVLKEEGYQES